MFGPFAKDGTLTVGGFWHQPFSSDRGYLQAARTLIDHGRPELIGLPVAYLQRHALELLLKALIEIVWVIRTERDWVAAGPGSPRPPDPPPLHEHPFPVLLGVLKEALADIGFETPDDFDQVAALFDDLEAVEAPDGTKRSHPDRLRYGTIGPAKASFDSFPKPVTIPLRERQERLEALVQTHLTIPDPPKPASSLFEQLFWQEAALSSTLKERGDLREDDTPLEELE